MPKSAEEQGEVLREFRVAAWMTTGDVGEALGGYKAQTVSAWEMGRNRPSRQILGALAKVVGAPLQLLLHELGEDVALPLVNGEPYTFGRWIDDVRARRYEERTLNSFTHRSGAARAKRKGTAGPEGQGSGIPYISVRSDDHRARASA